MLSLNCLNQHDELFLYLVNEFLDCRSIQALAVTCKSYSQKVNVVVEQAFELLGHAKLREECAQPLPLLLHLLRQLLPARDNRRKLSCGNAHTAIIARDCRKLIVFGQGKFGQLGHGTNEDQIVPHQVQLCNRDRIIAVSCGYNHTCILTGRREVFLSGAFQKQEEEKEDGLMVVPRRVINSRIPVRAVDAGCAYTAVLLDDAVGNVLVLGNGLNVDTVQAEGYGDYHVLHRGSYLEHFRIEKICCGYDHLLLLNELGQPFGVGNGEGGKLGVVLSGGNNVRRPKPVLFPWFEKTIVQFSAGFSHSALITKCGLLYTFGCGKLGQLGNGSYSMNSSIPTRVKLPFVDNFVVFVACGAQHTIVNTIGGKIIAFGNCCFGQAGVRSTFFATNKPQVVNIGVLSKSTNRILEIAAGNTHSALLTENAELFMFGELKYCGGSSYTAKYSALRPFSIEPSTVDLRCEPAR